MEAFDPKQPYEAYYVDFDFVNVLVDDDTISTATISAVDEDSADATATITDVTKQDIDSPKVYVWVRAGTTGKTYTITCKIVCTSGEKYELEGTLAVTEL